MLATSAAGPQAVRGGAMRVAGYLVGALVSVVAAALLLRHLGLIDTGRYFTALSLVAIVGSFSDLGLTAVGVRELSTRSPSEGAALSRDLLGLRLTLTLIGSIALVAIAWVSYSGTMAAGVALACGGLSLQAAQDNFTMPLLVGLRLGWVSALELSRQLLTTLFTVGLVLAGASLVPFLGISIPVGVVLACGSALLVRRSRALTPTFSLARWRAFASAMIPYSAATAASVLYFKVSIILVSALSNGHQLGYFGASFRIVEVLMAVPVLLVGSAFPIFARAARDDHERLGYALGRMFDAALIVGAWVAVSIAVGAPLAIEIVGGSSFAPAAPVLAIQGIALGVIFMNQTWSNVLLGLGVYRTILALAVGALALNATMVAVLVPLDGAKGAAIGTVIAEVVLALGQGIAVVRGRPHLRPSPKVVPWVALAAGLGLVPLAFTGLPVIARLAISTSVYALVLAAARAYPPELVDVVMRRGG